MPNTESAKKRLRQNAARCERNRAAKSTLRTAVKKVRVAVTEKNFDDAATAFRYATRLLDRAGARGLMHRKTAARTKSRLSALIKKAKAAAAA